MNVDVVGIIKKSFPLILKKTLQSVGSAIGEQITFEDLFVGGVTLSKSEIGKNSTQILKSGNWKQYFKKKY